MKYIELTNIIRLRNSISESIVCHLSNCKTEQYLLQSIIYMSMKKKIYIDIQIIERNIHSSLIKIIK